MESCSSVPLLLFQSTTHLIPASIAPVSPHVSLPGCRETRDDNIMFTDPTQCVQVVVLRVLRQRRMFLIQHGHRRR
jgi:hypothetical protein